MASTIKIKRSGVLNKVPTTSDIATGELAINYKDQKLYSSNGTGVFQIGTLSGSSGLVSITTATVKNLTQNDVVVTNVDVIAANGYVTTQDAAATYQTKAIERAALANTNLRINLINTNLTGTNTALRTLINARLQVANATTLFNTKATWTALTGTNTALRTLISDRLQVANAVATYQTKTVERAALANTNAYIAAQASRITLVNTNLTGTNTAIRALDAQKLSVANATSLLAAKSTWTALTGTNTALRTLISDRLQVANAVATYQTKSIERAALANTNASIAAQASRITLVNTNLTGTNTAIRALDAAKLSVANAVAIYQTKAIERAALANTNASITTQTGRINLINTNLTGTNTALRTLISDRLQVANAATIYQTKTIERAALANTNSRINLLNTNLTGTNTAIRALDAAKLSVANAVAIYATKSNPTTSGLLAHTGRATISTNLAVTGNTTVGGSLTVTGDLTINGTTTTLNSTTLTVDDKNIELGSVAVPTNITADGGGITLKGTTDKTFNWVSATAAWTSSENVNLASGKSLYLNGTDFRATFAANSYVKSVLANTNSFIKSQLANTNLRVNLINTNLTGTNTALRTLISDRLQVANAVATYQTKTVERAALANTNASIATQSSRITLVNTNLLGTNTAIRALDAAKLSVANAVAIYQTKATERAALANTNASIATQASRITLVNTNLLATNTAIRALDNAKLSVANAATLYATKSNPTTSGLLAHTGRQTISTNLAVSGNVSVTGTSTFTGAATFNGAITLGDAATDLLTVNGRATIGQNLSIAGNTTFSGTAKRVTGDFSNATVTNRLLFQSSTGTFTDIGALGPGAAQTSGWTAYYGNDPTNTSRARMVAFSTDARFESSITGSGTYLPMTFQTGGLERFRIHSYGLANVAQSMVIGKNISIAGNVNLTSTGNRITGDFTNATIGNRALFQTSTLNSTTTVGIIPNGTSVTSILELYGASTNLDNAPYGRIAMAPFTNEFAIAAGIRGTGTYVPILFYTGGFERFRIHTSGLANVAQSMVIGKNLYVAGNTILGNPAVVTDRTIINGVTVANGQLTVSGNTRLSGTLVANNTSGTSGFYLRTSGTGVYWSPVSGGGANGFSGILVGANVISADSTTDRLTFVAGSGITLAANPTTDTITISSTASGAAANVVTKAVKDLTQNDTVVTSVNGLVAGSGITTGKAIAMAIVFGG